MKVEQVIEALNGIKPSSDVKTITIDNKGIHIRYEREFESEIKSPVKMTKLCEELSSWKVDRLQRFLHENFHSNDKEIEDLKAFERILEKINKFGKAWELLLKEGD